MKQGNRKRKGPAGEPAGPWISGGADRDRTDGLLNAIRNGSSEDLKIPHDFDYPDAESGD
jgi:hypothetical protein